MISLINAMCVSSWLEAGEGSTWSQSEGPPQKSAETVTGPLTVLLATGGEEEKLAEISGVAEIGIVINVIPF